MQLLNIPGWQSLIFTRLHAMYLIFIFIFKFQQPTAFFFKDLNGHSGYKGSQLHMRHLKGLKARVQKVQSKQ